MAVVTLAQLRAEPYWDREIVPDPLRWLGGQLCAAYGRPRTAWGDRGNTAHLYGSHRSQEWIRNSRWCTNRSYTVQPSLTATQARWIAAGDWTPGVWGTTQNRAMVAAMTRRLVAAGTAGRLPGVFEVIGTLDGRRAVGIDLPEGQTWPASVDHLDHSHLGFDRRRVNDKAVMERVLAAALGEDDDMSKDDVLAGLRQEDEWASPGAQNAATEAGEGSPRSALVKLEYALDSVRYRGVKLPDKVEALLGRLDKATADAAAGHKATADVLASQTTALNQIAAALTTLTQLVQSGGGDAAVAALAARVDALGDTVNTMAGSVTGLAAAVSDLIARQGRRDAALADAYEDDDDA